MRIGIVCYPTFGGSGVLATELGKALAIKGHEIHFITYRQPVRLNLFSANIFYHEVPVPDYPLFEFPPYELALASTLVDVIKNHDLDLMHVHYAIPHASAAYMAQQIAKKTLGRYIPFITTLHGTDITLVGKDKTYEPVVTFSLNESDAITAVSNNLKDETLKFFPIEKDIEVIYNFVDVRRFDKRPVDAFKKVIAPNGERILVHASNFRQVKRVEDVVKIYAKLRTLIPAKLLMVGDGPERQGCENLARELGVCDGIRFLGKQEQMEEIMAISDLFLLPSQYESFGLAALEAMAAHVPVLSSNAGGLPEINIPGRTGYMFNIGDVDMAAQYAFDILKDEVTLQKFRDSAFRQAKDFDVSNIVPLYEHLYSQVLKNAIVMG